MDPNLTPKIPGYILSKKISGGIVFFYGNNIFLLQSINGYLMLRLFSFELHLEINSYYSFAQLGHWLFHCKEKAANRNI